MSPHTVSPPNRKKAVEYLIIAAVFIVALMPRALTMSHHAKKPLEPDANAFYSLAADSPRPWSASLREPFSICLYSIAVQAAGGKNWAIRINSLVFSLLLVLIVTRTSLQVMESRWAAGFSGMLLALTPYMSFQAVRGLRLETFLFLAMAATWLLLPGRELSWKRSALAGLALSALFLTRQTGIMIGAVMLAASALRLGRRQGIKAVSSRLGAAAMIAMALSAPFYINQHREYGSPFFISSWEATFWRNQEFRDQPGFPTSKEVREDSFTGEVASPFEYVFGMHSVKEIIKRVAEGYMLAFGFYYRHALGPLWWLLLLCAPGIIAMCARRHWEWPLLFLLVMLPFSFIIPLSVVGHRSVDARFAMHGYPLVVVFTGAGLDWMIRVFLHFRSRFVKIRAAQGGDGCPPSTGR